jgi:uncharacterized protein YndB with AHSA1/START domain
MRSLPPCELAWIEKAPAKIELTTYLTAPPDKVFAAFADAAGWTSWFPDMTEARWLDGATGGVGHERQVKLRLLGTFRERFIAWEPPHRFAFTIVETTSSMLHQLGEDYRLSADGSGTRFDWTMGSDPAGLGKLGTPLLRMMLRRTMRRGIAKLDRQLTGR